MTDGDEDLLRRHLPALVEALEDPDAPWEDDWALRIDGFSAAGDDGVLLELVAMPNGGPPRPLRVLCDEVADLSIRVGVDAVLAVDLTRDHPTLLVHTGPQDALFFRGAPPHPRAAAYGLLAALRDVAGDWIAPLDVLNPNIASNGLSELLASGHGRLADGPRPVVAAFAAALEADGVQATVLEGGTPDDERDGLMSLVLGESYVVARRFRVAE